MSKGKGRQRGENGRGGEGEREEGRR